MPKQHIRLTQPLVRDSKDAPLRPASWDDSARSGGRRIPGRECDLLVSGHRQGRTTDEQLTGAVDQVRTLNRAASEVLVEHGATHNRRFVAPALSVADGIDDALVALAHDPQTSGGLLGAIPLERLDAVRAGLDDLDDTVRALNAAGVQAWQVGRVEAGAPAVALR